jgi:GNAT superfamily N-acetyltransferase
VTETRRASPADLARVLELAAEFCAYEGYERAESHTRAALEPLLADDAVGQVWLGVAAGRVVGYAVLTWGWGLESGGREGLLDEIYVSDRGAGVGGALVRRVVAAARDAGCRTLFLETEKDNERQRTFYARHGLEEQDSVWMSVTLG